MKKYDWIRGFSEGRKLWAEAVIKARGNVTLEWLEDGSCKLETGEAFKGA